MSDSKSLALMLWMSVGLWTMAALVHYFPGATTEVFIAVAAVSSAITLIVGFGELLS